MIFKTGCKINLGLRVLSKRPDGYHNLSTVFFPVSGIWDLIEIVPSDTDCFSCSGITVDCPAEKNLCIIALRKVRDRFSVPPCAIHLHKTIPFGAGLGAGSANAMGVIEGLNTLFSLGMTLQQKLEIGGEIGSDVPFFAVNRPQAASGRGEILRDVNVDLSGKYLVIAKPEGGVSTKEAYAGVTQDPDAEDVAEIVTGPVSGWRGRLVNDFEPSVISKVPEIGALKKTLYDAGALYAAMSGSGSAVFGIFDSEPEIDCGSIIMCDIIQSPIRHN